MGGHWTGQFSFLAGCIRYSDLGYLLLSDDSVDQRDVAHSQIITLDGGNWGNAGQRRWTAVSACVCAHPIAQMVAIGPYGEAVLLGSGDIHDEAIGSGTTSPETMGPLRCVNSIDGRAVAVGMNRQAYRRDGVGTWTPLNLGTPTPSTVVVGFEGVDGFSSGDMYAVGWEGEIWWLNHGAWERIDSPTNLILFSVCCAPDGVAYACGQAGTILRGRERRWDAICENEVSEDLYDIAWFDDTIFLASNTSVYRLVDGTVKPVDFGDDIPASCYSLSVCDDTMWSIGSKDVMAFDGKGWSRVD